MKMFDENKSLSEVVEALDFSSKPHFLKVFKRYTGMWPSEYKRDKTVFIK